MGVSDQDKIDVRDFINEQLRSQVWRGIDQHCFAIFKTNEDRGAEASIFRRGRLTHIARAAHDWNAGAGASSEKD